MPWPRPRRSVPLIGIMGAEPTADGGFTALGAERFGDKICLGVDIRLQNTHGNYTLPQYGDYARCCQNSLTLSRRFHGISVRKVLIDES